VSRIGKQPINMPKGVSVTVAGQKITVKGPLGELTYDARPEIKITVEGDVVSFSADPIYTSYWGLVRATVNTMVIGVSKGYTKSLEIYGTGYKAELKGQYLTLFLGYSHEVWYEIPKGLKAEVKDSVKITLSSVDKQLIGQAAATIRSFRKPEPYKGKGVRYSDEVIKRKAGKTGKK